MRKLKIVHIASECAPFIKTGGLADVVGSLPKAQNRSGHEVLVVIPKYAQINSQEYGITPAIEPIGVKMGNVEEWCSASWTERSGFGVYLIESQKYFNRFGLYHDSFLNDYLDNPLRFGFFTRAALQLCRDLRFKPDIIHVHDWQAALAPAYLKLWHWNDEWLGHAASVLTIHNLAYQGVYPAGCYEYLGLQWLNFVPEKLEDHGQVNFLKGGIVYADVVNTVSSKYAQETRTPDLGFGLAPFLNDRDEDYRGILNGCDYDIWDPRHDPLIPARYSPESLEGKSFCKQELQRKLNLTLAADVPIVACISRLVSQKGLDLLAKTIGDILDQMQIQFVLLGAGEKSLENYYSTLPGKYPGRAAVFIGYNNELSHWIEAGADFFVMPSIYEPCGLNQIYSLRYGTLPIVRATGGLDDTVDQYDERNGTGTGFKFWEPSARAIYFTIGWAVSTYYDRPVHMRKLILQAMAQDFSWQRSADKYDNLYQKAIIKHESHQG